MTPDKITVIGDGGWGTALAMVLCRNGHHVTVWGVNETYVEEMRSNRENSRYLPGTPFPDNLALTADRDVAVQNAEGFIVAVPSKFYQNTLAGFAGVIPASAKVCSVSKGLRDDRRLSEWAQEVLQLDDVSALSGPSHAEEVAHEAPTAVTVASTNPDHADTFQAWFNQSRFRVYTSDDLVGLELGGALKNIIAIAAGVSDGLGFGDNTKAALITRGLAELTRLGVAAGGKPDTFGGLSGVGDLIVTCGSRHSRNRGVGERLGKGESMEEIEASMQMVAEGVWNAQTARQLAHHLGIPVPITEEVYSIIYEGKNPLEAVTSLLSRDPKPEIDS